MNFTILTIFPNLIDGYTNESILRRGQKAGHISIRTVNIRDFTTDKHKTVDDTPYGGGAGMVMKPEPIHAALRSVDGIPFHKSDGFTKLKKIAGTVVGNPKTSLRVKKRTVLLSPRGRQFDQRIAEDWASLDELTLICGRYEGVDQRVVDHMIDEEISVGPYVLAGGELGALVIIEAVSRLIPGVLGNPDSLEEETHNTASLHHCITASPIVDKSDEVMRCSSDVVKEYPQYTKPAEFMGWKVPEILLSGNHGEIKKW